MFLIIRDPNRATKCSRFSKWPRYPRFEQAYVSATASQLDSNDIQDTADQRQHSRQSPIPTRRLHRYRWPWHALRPTCRPGIMTPDHLARPWLGCAKARVTTKPPCQPRTNTTTKHQRDDYSAVHYHTGVVRYSD